MWDGISFRDWTILGIFFVAVIAAMSVLVFVYRKKYLSTSKVLKIHAGIQLDKFLKAEKETIETINTMRKKLQEVVAVHEKEKSALEHEVHLLKKKLVHTRHAQGNEVEEMTKVKLQMEELKKSHNDAIKAAEEQIEMMKRQLDALRWRL